MIQITFQPAFDSLHSVFRMLRIRPIVSNTGPLHIDHIRILDFYLAFPHRLKDARLKPGHRWIKRLTRTFGERKPYGEAPDDRSLFLRMEAFQVAALETLTSKGYYFQTESQSRIITATSTPLPTGLEERVSLKNAKDESLLRALHEIVSSYNFFGVDGIKDRSRLMEFRHDTI